MKKVGGIWSHIIFRRIVFEGADQKVGGAGIFFRELMTKVGGIWSHIIFRQILFEGADEESWRDLEPYNFSTDSF